MKKIKVKFKRLNKRFDDVELPKYATEGSSGLDVRATVECSMEILPGQIVLVPTNLISEIPFGYEIQVRPRSGLAIKNGIGLLNSPGTIDADYRGEIKIIIFNMGKEKFTINRGDRIAQFVIAEVIKADVEESDDLTNTERGIGGFGHTGKN